jgi:hypothetical protein
MGKLVNLEIKYVAEDSLDLGFDDDGWERLDLWKPDKHFHIILTLAIGLVGDVASNYFYLSVRTPNTGPLDGSLWKPDYTLLVHRFNWRKTKSAIKDRVMSCAA